MTLIKKISALTICAIIFVVSIVCVDISADYTVVSNNSICIKTKKVPDDVVEYAKVIFSSLYHEDMYNLGFDENTISQMGLGYPFDINEVKSNKSNYEFYYFPIISNNRTVAVMTISVNIANNSMNYQVGETELSRALNKNIIPTSDPVEIFMNDDCCYALDTKSGDIYVLYVFNESFYKYLTDNEYNAETCVVKVTENAYVKTGKAPDEVVEYAEEIFSGLYYNYMTLCDSLQINNSSKSALSEHEHYYFPIVDNDKVVSMMIISYNNINKEMSYQITNSPDRLSKALNKMSSSFEEPFEIFMNDFCCYAVYANGYVQVMYVLPTASSATSAYYKTYNQTDDNEESYIIHIDGSDVFEETLKINISREYVAKKLTVVYVDNKIVDKMGTCWASCVGCLSNYYSDGEKDASDMRDLAIKDYGSVGNYETAQKALKKYNKLTMTYQKSKMIWNSVKIQINKNQSPFYSRWTSSTSTEGHAMVVSGYRYDNADSSNTSKYGVYVMDPNENTNILIGYGGIYSINGNDYSWNATLYKS